MIEWNHRKLEQTLSEYLKNFPVPAHPEARDRTLREGWSVMEDSLRSDPDPMTRRWNNTAIWRVGRVVAIAAVLIAAISITLPHWFSKPTWALEQSLNAIKNLHGLYLEGTFLDEKGQMQGCEIWMRADRMGRQSKDMLMKSSGGAISWVAKGCTYYYVPYQETVIYEQAVTAGISPWPGPHLLELLSKADNARITYDYDSIGGGEKITLSSSIVNVKGPQSWIMNFDVTSKRPVSFKIWNNLDRAGSPNFWARKVTYSGEIPDSQMTPQVPAEIKYVEKGPSIPDQNLALLLSPRFGLAAGGLELQDAAAEILRRVYTAMIQEDFGQIRKLCPVADLWNDDFLRGILLGNTPKDRIREIVSIGQITQEGHSQAGPFVVVPVTVRRQDGSLWRDQMIVQFRGGLSPQSCVVYGPYGQSVEVD